MTFPVEVGYVNLSRGPSNGSAIVFAQSDYDVRILVNRKPDLHDALYLRFADQILLGEVVSFRASTRGWTVNVRPQQRLLHAQQILSSESLFAFTSSTCERV